eukprot:1194195-Prorocentrum_minimum.AAC.2
MPVPITPGDIRFSLRGALPRGSQRRVSDESATNAAPESRGSFDSLPATCLVCMIVVDLRWPWLALLQQEALEATGMRLERNAAGRPGGPRSPRIHTLSKRTTFQLVVVGSSGNR